MPNRKTRERQLAKLQARRAAERRRKRRQRAVALAVGGLAAAGLLAILFVVFLRGSPKAKVAATPRATASVSPSPTVPAGTVACGGSIPNAAASPHPTFVGAPAMTVDTKKAYTVTMATSCGKIVIQLDPKTSPNTVNSIVFLIKQHFYDGLTFHRVVPGFVIQGGDPKGNGSGGPGYSTVDTPPTDAKYPVGTVAMAKAGSEAPGTSGSQFFVVLAPSAQDALAPGGKGQYAIVGTVIKGMDTVNRIAAVPIASGTQDTPSETIYIERVTVKVS